MSGTVLLVGLLVEVLLVVLHGYRSSQRTLRTQTKKVYS
ncbi:hypothetical protein DLP3_122 [Stenotrophomonas phage vB_SmaS_DLP_3]|nr:hypothetical protein DLP3_122 [Stenotrophomonas phage vB_SmaS_DLP_3]